MRNRCLFVLCLLLCFLCACAEEPVPERTPPATVIPIPTGGTVSQETEPTVNGPVWSTEPTENTEPMLPWAHEAALTNLLEDTNYHGEYLPGDGLPVPGSLIPVELIPAASQSRVGETVSIILAQRQQAIPFYYRCTAEGEERLAVFIDAKIPMLVIFETELGGIKELHDHIQSETVFQGKILSMTNLDRTEGSVYAKSRSKNTENVLDGEILTDGTSLTAGECVGVVGTDDGSTAITVIKGGRYETASDGLKDDIDWMKQVFQRYSLENVTQ